jgi:hypothetical protein
MAQAGMVHFAQATYRGILKEIDLHSAAEKRRIVLARHGYNMRHEDRRMLRQFIKDFRALLSWFVCNSLPCEHCDKQFLREEPTRKS